jgi:hypothetical protein
MKKILLSISLFVGAMAANAQQIPNYIPSNDLLMWIPFDSNFVDVSSNPNNITNSGVTLMADRNGIPNRAGSFNGTGASMQASSPTFTFAKTDTFTYSVWVKKDSHTSAGQNADIALMSGTGTTGVFISILQFSNTSTAVSFGVNKQQTSWAWANSTYNLSQWDHYCAVYQGGSMSLYLNGNLVGSNNFTTTGSSAVNIPFYIGRGLGTVTFKGGLDDIAVWGRALNTQEISDVYNNVFTGIELKSADVVAKVYPNPASDLIYINVKSNYEIKNLLGSSVAIGNTTNGSINIEQLPAGVYFLNLGGESTKSIKFIKR